MLTARFPLPLSTFRQIICHAAAILDVWRLQSRDGPTNSDRRVFQVPSSAYKRCALFTVFPIWVVVS